jgi:hypothetical protein
VGIEAVTVTEWIGNLPNWTIIAGAVTAAASVIVGKVVAPVVRWAQRLEDSVTYVRKEMEFNGGSSARDAIARLEDSVAMLLAHDAERDQAGKRYGPRDD